MIPLGRGAGRAAGLVLALLVLTPGTVPAVEIELYHPRHRPPEELEELAEGLLAPEGAALADPRSGALVLRGSRDALDRTRAALRRLDRPPERFRIELRRTSHQELWGRGVEIGGWLDTGPLRIGRIAPHAAEPGLGVIFGRLASSQARQVDETRTLLEGSRATFWTGTVLPVELLTTLGLDAKLQSLDTIPSPPLRTGLRVRPRSLAGGRIELEIAAVVEAPNRVGGVRLTGAPARVVLRPGEPLVVASGEAEGGDAVETPFGTWLAGSATEGTLSWLAVRREGSDPRP